MPTLPRSPEHRALRRAEARIRRLERQIAAYEHTRRKLDRLADTLGHEILDDLERLDGAVRLLAMADEPDAGIETARELEVLGIERELGLPPVESDDGYAGEPGPEERHGARRKR